MARAGRSFPLQPVVRPRLVAPDPSAAVDLAGAGALTVAATATGQAAVALAGSGQLTAAGTPVAQASVTLAGAGALTTNATPVAQASVTLAGAGQLSVSAGQTATVTLTGAGSLSVAAPTQTFAATATLAGAGALSVAAQSTQQVAVTLAGAGSLTTTAARVQPATVALAGAGSLSVAGTRVHPATVALAGAGSLVASAVRAAAASAALTGAGQLITTGKAVASGGLNVALWAVDRTTGALVALPQWRKLSFSRVQNTPGAISVEYPADDAGFDTLRANITADRDLEVEIWLGGRASTALRGILQQARGDDVTPGAVWTFSGGFLELLLAEVVVYPVANAEKQELRFTAASPGAIVSTLLSQAQARGALTGMTTDCTNTLDSSGTAWPEFATIKFSPGATYLAVLQRLVALGLIEFEVTPARVLRVYRPGYMGADRTTGNFPTIIRRGRNVTESPRSHSVQESVTTVLAAGAEGIYASASDAAALARRGRRIEGTASSNNLTDLGAVQAFAGRTLATQTPGEMELLLGLSFGIGHPRPQTHYSVGDWVWADSTGTLERLRVAQLTLDLDAAGPTGSVTLNDLRTDWRIRAERRLSALQDGDVVIGTSTQSPGEDTVAPAAPTGITVGSDAYQSDGADFAVVYVGWTAPTTNSDGSALFDLAGFRARLEVPGAAPGVYAISPDVGATATQLQMSGVQTGVGVRVSVQAFDRDGNTSAWSTAVDHTTESDTTAPPAPSTPVVTPYLGQLKIRWDGLSNVGSAMPEDLDRVEVHLSATNNFTPSATTLIDQFATEPGERIATDLPYGTTRYCKLVGIDRTGNVGPASAQASAVPEQVVSADVFDGAIGSAKLADLAVTTAKINLLAVNDAQVGNLSVGKLTAGTLSASVTLSGIFRTATTGRRMEIDSAGWRAYKTDGTTKVAELNITGETMLMTGTYQSGLSGERIYLLTDGTQRFYGPSGTDFCEIRNEAASGPQAEPFLRFRGFGSNATSDSMGNLYLASDNATLTWGNSNWGTEPTAVRLDSTTLQTRSPNTTLRTTNLSNKLFLSFRNGVGGGDIGSANLWHKYVSGDPLWGAPGQGVGLLFSDGVLYCCDEAGTSGSRRQINASGFIADCTVEAKVNIRDLRTNLRGGRKLRDIRLRMRKFQRAEDLVERPEKPGFKIARPNPDTGVEEWVDADWAYPQRPAPTYVGPIAEELEAIDPDLVSRDPVDGRLGVQVMTVASLALEQATAAFEEIDALSAQVTALMARLNAPPGGRPT